MALLFVDGFPYATAELPIRYTMSGFFARTVETGGRFGGRYLKLGGGGSGTARAKRLVGGTEAVFAVQCGMYPHAYVVGGSNCPFEFWDTTTLQCYLLDDNGFLKFYRGDGNLQATASGVLTSSTWHQLELKVTIDNANGTCLLKVDGIEVINESGLDTQMSANALANGIGYSVVEGTMYISDVIMMDTTGTYCKDLLGSRMVQVCMPTDAGNYAQWAPSAGANWETVDEATPDTGDYNEGDVNEIDTFQHDALMNSGATIDAVVLSPYAKTNDGGSALIKGVARSNGTDGFGNELAVPSSESYLQSIIYENPDTTAPFTPAEFDAAEFGYKRTA